MNSKVELSILVLSTISVVVILFDYLYALDDSQKYAIYIFDAIVVVVLAIDFHRRYKQSNEGRKFLLKHWYEIPAMMPLFALVTLEAQGTLLVEATIRGFRLIRLFRIVHLFFRTTSLFKGSRFAEIIIFAAGVVIIGGLAGFLVESSDPNSKMLTVEDSLWWAMVTVTTVGYGDVYPVTSEGRIIGVFLMITGVATFAMLTSRLGAALLESKMKKKQSVSIAVRHQSISQETAALIKQKIDEIANMDEKELNTLTAMIKTLWQAGKKKEA